MSYQSSNSVNSHTNIEPLFYRGRGITVVFAVFTIIWRGFPATNFFLLLIFFFLKSVCSSTTIGLYRDVWIAAIASSRKSLAT